MDLILKLIVQLGILLLIVISGLLLHTKGNPYPKPMFNLHKLLAIGLIVFIGSGIYYSFNVSIPGIFTILGLVLLGLSAISLLISGALTSNNKVSFRMIRLHKVSTFVFILGALMLAFMK